MDFMEKYFGTIKRENDDTIISAEEARQLRDKYMYDQMYYQLKEYINPIIKSAIKSNEREIYIKSSERIFSIEEIKILKDLGYETKNEYLDNEYQTFIHW